MTCGCPDAQDWRSRACIALGEAERMRAALQEIVALENDTSAEYDCEPDYTYGWDAAVSRAVEIARRGL